MTEYIIACDEETALWVANDVDSMKPIVRCRDCKHMEVFHPFDVFRLKPSEQAEYHCTSSQFSNWDFPIEVDPDGYCAWGEPKEGS